MTVCVGENQFLPGWLLTHSCCGAVEIGVSREYFIRLVGSFSRKSDNLNDKGPRFTVNTAIQSEAFCPTSGEKLRKYTVHCTATMYRFSFEEETDWLQGFLCDK